MEQLTTAIALAIAVSMGCLYYKKIMTGGSKNQKFIERAKAGGNFTTGTYVNLEVLSGDRSSRDYNMRSKELRVRYQYQVNGVDYFKYLHFQNIGRISVDFPISVTVYYDPKNPKKAVCPEEASKYQQKQSGCLGAVIIGIIIMAVLINLFKFLLG